MKIAELIGKTIVIAGVVLAVVLVVMIVKGA